MREKLKNFLSIAIIIMFLPYVFTMIFNGGGEDESIEISSLSADTSVDVELLVMGSVAKQISVNNSEETIKAQSVIARTNIEWALDNNKDVQKDYMTTDDMREMWGNDAFLSYYEYIKSQVSATKGEVIHYNKKLVWLPFHAVSAGSTRDGDEVLKSDDYEYLQPIVCEEDMLSENYLWITLIKKEDLVEILDKKEKDITAKNVMDKIDLSDRDKYGYANTAIINGNEYSGEELRELLMINSSCMYIEETGDEEDNIRIVTKGLGNGLGMSQYGAEKMAQNGSDYREILEHYYKNIEIVNE